MRKVIAAATKALLISEVAVAIWFFIDAVVFDVLAAITYLAIGLVVAAPLAAVSILLSDVEFLEMRISALEKILEKKDSPKQEIPELKRGRNAILTWTCPKCGTVNKPNTSNCEHCGSAY